MGSFVVVIYAKFKSVRECACRRQNRRSELLIVGYEYVIKQFGMCSYLHFFKILGIMLWPKLVLRITIFSTGQYWSPFTDATTPCRMSNAFVALAVYFTLLKVTKVATKLSQT